jgi:hypothetical protein
LNAATASFDRGNATSGLNQLEAFQNQVRAQISPRDAASADALTQAARKIINAFVDSSHSSKIVRLIRRHQQNLRLELAGQSGRLHLLQASTNLLDWVTVGAASDRGNGTFEFEDSEAVRFPNRYYRVVSP